MRVPLLHDFSLLRFFTGQLRAENFAKSIKHIVWLLLLTQHDGICGRWEENLLTKHVCYVGEEGDQWQHK